MKQLQRIEVDVVIEENASEDISSSDSVSTFLQRKATKSTAFVCREEERAKDWVSGLFISPLLAFFREVGS